MDDYLRRGWRQKQTQHKDHGGRWEDPTWLPGPFVFAPYQSPSSHPPWVRGNVSYFRLVKGESNEPLGVITANSKP